LYEATAANEADRLRDELEEKYNIKVPRTAEEIAEVKARADAVPKVGVPAEADEEMPPSLAELAEKWGKYRIPWVMKGFFARKQVTLVVGSPKGGKTTLMLQALYRIATGEPWAFAKNRKSETFPVLYYS